MKEKTEIVLKNTPNSTTLHLLKTHTVANIKTVITSGLLLAFFISPFVVWPYALVRYEVPRVFFWQVVSVILGTMTLVQLVITKQKPKIFFPFVVSSSLWLASVLLSNSLNQNWTRAWFGNYYRADGILTVGALVLICLSLSQWWHPKWRLSLAYVSLIAASLISTWVLSDSLRLLSENAALIPSFNGVPGVSFGQPNFLAGYLLLNLPWLYYVCHHATSLKSKWLTAGCGVLLITTLFLTNSWGSILGLGFLAVSLICYHVKRLRVIPVMALLLAFAFNTYAYWEGMQTYYPESRARIFYRAYLAIQEKPFFGWGWAHVDTALAHHQWPTQVLHDVYVDKAHSHFLEILITTGFIGLVAYSLLLFIIFREAVRQAQSHKDSWHITLLIVLSLYLYHTQTNVIGIAEEVIFWVAVGLVATSHRSEQK